MKLFLKIWRQKNSQSKGKIVDYEIDDISPDMSFLEMMDVLNEKIIDEDGDPVAFDHDCREGICGSCSMFINGEPHGPDKLITTCQLHMRRFKDGDTIYIEPFRARAFPIIKDLVVDRTAFDRIQQSGGFISINTSGNTLDANTIPIEKENADKLKRLEYVKIPKDIDYFRFSSLSNESKEKLSEVRPVDIGQAARISGIKPSDVSILLIYLGR